MAETISFHLMHEGRVQQFRPARNPAPGDAITCSPSGAMQFGSRTGTGCAFHRGHTARQQAAPGLSSLPMCGTDVLQPPDAHRRPDRSRVERFGTPASRPRCAERAEPAWRSQYSFTGVCLHPADRGSTRASRAPHLQEKFPGMLFSGG
jgi:hypothetical protein